MIFMLAFTIALLIDLVAGAPRNNCPPGPFWTAEDRNLIKENHGHVTLVALMELQCQECISQLNGLMTLKRHVEKNQYIDTHFVVVASWREPQSWVDHWRARLHRANILLVQEDRGKPVWEALSGKAQDFFVYDKCGRLAFYVPYPQSALYYHYTISVIHNTYYGWCGPCKPQKEKVQKVQQEQRSTQAVFERMELEPTTAATRRRPITTTEAPSFRISTIKAVLRPDYGNATRQSDLEIYLLSSTKAPDRGRKRKDRRKLRCRKGRCRGRKKGRRRRPTTTTTTTTTSAPQTTSTDGTDEYVYEYPESEEVEVYEVTSSSPSSTIPEDDEEDKINVKNVESVNRGVKVTGDDKSDVRKGKTKDKRRRKGKDKSKDKSKGKGKGKGKVKVKGKGKDDDDKDGEDKTSTTAKYLPHQVPGVDCDIFTDDYCFQQQENRKPLHPCCTKGVYLTNLCVPGKCTKDTYHLCCFQRFQQSRFRCCNNGTLTCKSPDEFSHCCYDLFATEGETDDPCCPAKVARRHWNVASRVIEYCVPNIELDYGHLELRARMAGSSYVRIKLADAPGLRYKCPYSNRLPNCEPYYYEPLHSEEYD